MQVIGMRRIVVRRQYCCEAAAGSVPYGVEESGGIACSLPICADADPSSVSQHKGADINGIAASVLAPLLPTTDAPATRGSEVFDADHMRAQY